jgi:hypothetical protein
MAKNKELQTQNTALSQRNNTMRELQALAEQKSAEILQRINSTTERISKSKQAADLAKAMKSGLFGKTAKKTDATANAIVAANAALTEMNDLIQGSIELTCSSRQFAEFMIEEMSNEMINGIEDAGRKITEFSTETHEAMKVIIDATKEFVAKQKADEKRQKALEKKHSDLQLKLDEKDREHIKHIKKIQKTLAKKDLSDKEQAEIIQKITEELRIHKIITLVLSITSLVISLGTLVFFIIQKY